MATKRAALAPPLPAPASRRERRRQNAVVAAARRPGLERRYRQTLRRVDVWSVLKVSVCFYLSALVVFLLAGVILWAVADTAGLIQNVEDFVSDLRDGRPGLYTLQSLVVLRAATLLGLVAVCLMTVLTVLAAAFYNLFADLVGGIEVTVVEDA